MTQQHQPVTPGRSAGHDADHRPIPVITAELAEVERHLREVPPHHGGGAADLSARADALRRELARARTTHERADRTARRQEQQAQQ